MFATTGATSGWRNALGVIGVLAAASASCSDLLLQYSPGLPRGTPDSWEYTSVMMAAVPTDHMIAGHYLGIYSIPFYLCGVMNVAAGLVGAGAIGNAFLLVSAVSVCVSAVYHGQMVHAGLCVKSAGPPYNLQCPDTASLLQVQLIIAGALVALQGVLLLVALLSGRHVFPQGKLFAFVCNPLTALLAMAVVARTLQTDAANALMMASANLAYLFLFAVSTASQWSTSPPEAQLPAKNAPAL